ncbi:MAG: polysaccharide deacetylase family protein [Acidimicrobiaceae bacterium]|nr:polysaccharide deacetylase family protein [Acidimicrobiaceae bacterium]
MNSLILTAVLGGACQVQPGPDSAPVAAESAVTEPPETSDRAKATSGRPSPTLSAPAADPAGGPASSEPSGDARVTDDVEASEEGTGGQPAVEQELEPDLAERDAAEPGRLPAGLEAVLRESFPDSAPALHPEVARGDLDGDGSDDIVVHVEPRSADSPQQHMLVPVIDTGAAFDVHPPVGLGRRIIIDALGIRNGGIEVSFFDRSPGEPLTLITRRTTMYISPEPTGADSEDTAGWGVTVTRVEPIDNVPALHITRPQTPVAFELDGVGAAPSDRIALRERHRYVVHLSENEVVVAALAAPTGVWLEARLGSGAVLVPVAERTQRFAARVPAGGAWTVTVASSLSAPVDYRLSVEVFPPGLGDRIDTRDPDDFWSSTHMSPPALPDEGPVVYLTFDDGPHPVYTPQVLDVLARHGAKATFFVVGALAESYPLLIQRIAHEGHTLANHSWDHGSLARISRAAFDRSVGRTQELLGPLATSCLRPPYWDLGASTGDWSGDLGLRLVGWTYSPRDWEQPSAEAIADGIVARTVPGAVLLLHDGGGPRSATVRGLDVALERLSGRGLEFKPLCR